MEPAFVERAGWARALTSSREAGGPPPAARFATHRILQAAHRGEPLLPLAAIRDAARPMVEAWIRCSQAPAGYPRTARNENACERTCALWAHQGARGAVKSPLRRGGHRSVQSVRRTRCKACRGIPARLRLCPGWVLSLQPAYSEAGLSERFTGIRLINHRRLDAARQ